jgi:hypothetical protein
MGRAFGLVLILIAMYVGMTLYTEGMENAFGGVFAPIRPQSQREAPLATHLTPGAQFEVSGPTDRERRGRVTEVVRERVSADLQHGRERRGY